MDDYRAPAALFEDTVPLPFLQDTLRMLFAAYRVASDECRELPWEVTHDFRGHVRRKEIEKNWPGVATKYQSDGVYVSYQLNRRKTAYFTQVSCGRVILTESYVATPETIVRRADFRKTFARSNQPTLFGDDHPPLPADPLYALLIHGEDNKARHPYFADIVFPDPTVSTYLARIGLFSVFHSLIGTLIAPTQEEVIPDAAMPQLRAEEGREA
jgi:hypothetical protein